MYRDGLGLIVQKNQDGGDTLQRTGFYYLPWLIKKDEEAIQSYLRELELLWSAEGPTRHIKQYPEQKQVSRDQLTPNVAALGFVTEYGKIKYIFTKLFKNFFRYPNCTDVASPEHIGIFIRALNWKWCYPYLILGDLFMLLGVIIRCIQAKDPDNVGDDLNTLVSISQAQHVLPTPISWAARKYYKRFRPLPYLTLDGPRSTNNIFLALVWYFREESGGNPEIALAWKEICDNL